MALHEETNGTHGAHGTEYQREVYKGWEIIVEPSEHGEVHVTIGGKPVHIMRDQFSGLCHAHDLPYYEAESVMDLARSIVDNVPSYRRKKPEGEKA